MQTTRLTQALGAFDAAMQAVRPVEFHHAGCGRRRGFLSAADARAYEQGYGHYPAPLPLGVEGPRRDGWRDAEAEVNEQLYQFRNPQRPSVARDFPLGVS